MKNNIYGLDFDVKLAQISKAHMIIFGSEENNIHLLDTLNIDSWSEDEKKDISNFDVIITNPPFAGRIENYEILKNYTLSKQSHYKKGFPKKVTRDILFLERCISLLKDGGKLGIVLPHGITNNSSMKYVIEFLFEKGHILAVVSFDEYMFKPYTSAKTCFLLFEKINGPKDNKSIFFALSEKSGKTSKGNYVLSDSSPMRQLKFY